MHKFERCEVSTVVLGFPEPPFVTLLVVLLTEFGASVFAFLVADNHVVLHVIVEIVLGGVFLMFGSIELARSHLL